MQQQTRQAVAVQRRRVHRLLLWRRGRFRIHCTHAQFVWKKREDDAVVGGKAPGLCTACGKLICGECWPRVVAAVGGFR